MKVYNGFSGDQRAAAQRWLNMMIATGRLTRPTICSACGQAEGPIDMHAEDYSLPFAIGKTDEFRICYSCHMAVHCRFRQPVAWDVYRNGVAQGRRYPAIGRNFPQFIKWFSGDMFAPLVMHDAPARFPTVSLSPQGGRPTWRAKRRRRSAGRAPSPSLPA